MLSRSDATRLERDRFDAFGDLALWVLPQSEAIYLSGEGQGRASRRVRLPGGGQTTRERGTQRNNLALESWVPREDGQMLKRENGESIAAAEHLIEERRSGLISGPDLRTEFVANQAVIPRGMISGSCQTHRRPEIRV